jgi:ribosomal protein S4
MVRKPKAFYAVKNAVRLSLPSNYPSLTTAKRIRASWNKLNLYNVSQLRPQPTSFQTFFQQKWYAKRLMRGYHGEQLRERRWTNLYKISGRAPPAAVTLSAEYLARNDGSDQAAGRGAGLQDEVGGKGSGLGAISPYMAHTFWIVERRLDTAIHRAMFASSVRQARQMVIHGNVKVNGEKVGFSYWFWRSLTGVDVAPVLLAESRGHVLRRRRPRALGNRRQARPGQARNRHPSHQE